MGVALVKYHPGWMKDVKVGRPIRMRRGDALKDQTSQKKLRELGQLFTVQEVADMLKISIDTVYDMVKKEIIKGRKIGRHVRIAESDLQEILNA